MTNQLINKFDQTIYLKHCQDCDEKIKSNPKLKTEICYDCRGTTIKSKMKKNGKLSFGEAKYYFCPPCSQFINQLKPCPN